MHSPLPDASALEAGILEDETPSRLSRVQDNVRNLLRTSRFGSVHGSPPATPAAAAAAHLPTLNNGIPTLPETPMHRMQPQTEALPSPAAENTPSTTTSSAAQDDEAPGGGVQAAGFRDALYRMAHQSALFNTRAIAALDHPDLSHPSLATYLQQKSEGRHRRAWVRRRDGKTRHVAVHVGSSQGVLCVLAALLLSAIVATYIVLATTAGDITPTFHILFILGIILASIVFAHTLVRLLLASRKTRGGRRVFILPASPSRHHRHRREHHRDHPPRIMPVQPSNTTAFVPPTPIQVHMPADEVRPDSREAQPTAAATVEVSLNDWHKDVESVPNPPPAYGRWRGSVRANPDLLHWQAVPSPVDDNNTPELPSPTYEEAMAAQRTRPPSYVTKASPARQREMHEASSEADRGDAQAQSAEPEMVEGRGIGLGV